MGLGPFSRNCGIYENSEPIKNINVTVTLKDKAVVAPAPNPHNFKILNTFSIGSYLVLKVKYPNCTNYEGVKIMVYHDKDHLRLYGIQHKSSLDPHFNNKKDSTNPSPIARFEPTAEGWKNAKKFVKMLYAAG